MTITEIKSSAKLKLKNCYIKCASTSLLYFLVVTILTYLSNAIQIKLSNHSIILVIIQAIFALISITLSYGLITNIIALINNETKSITKFIDFSITNSENYIKLTLNILIRILAPIILFLLSVFYLIGTLIAQKYQQNFLCFYSNLVPIAIIVNLIFLAILIYFILKYVLSIYIYNSNNDLPALEIINKSNELMKGNKLKYTLLILSFFGWLLLEAIILYILNHFIPTIYLTPLVVAFYSLIKPYIIISELSFYESIDN